MSRIYLQIDIWAPKFLYYGITYGTFKTYGNPLLSSNLWISKIETIVCGHEYIRTFSIKAPHPLIDTVNTLSLFPPHDCPSSLPHRVIASIHFLLARRREIPDMEDFGRRLGVYELRLSTITHGCCYGGTRTKGWLFLSPHAAETSGRWRGQSFLRACQSATSSTPKAGGHSHNIRESWVRIYLRINI